MKAKRILCTLLVLCMLLPLLPAGTVFADKEERGKWQYRIYLHTSSTKNAEANVTQSGKPVPAIKATLSFTADGEERSQSEMITNTKKKQYSETFEKGDSDGWVTMDYAPWSFKNLKLENLYTDCYRFYSVELQARYIQDVNYPNYEKFGSDKITMFKKYPGGENKKESGGWEIKKGSDANFDYRSNAYGNTRTVTSTGNFANLGGEIHISVNRKDSKDQNYASNGTTQEVNWDGTIADGYSAAFNATGYNALAETNAPKLTFGYVLGTANGKSISVDDLGYYGVAITKKGYSYNPETLFKAMGDRGVGRFSCMLRLYVDGGLANSTLVTFVRDTFEVDTPVLTNYNYLYTQGTDYIINYNKSGNQIDATFYMSIASAYAITDYNIAKLDRKELTFDEAYIESKDTEGNTIKLYASGGNKITLGKSSRFTLSFPYSDDDELVDTGDNGLTVVIKGGKIVSDGVTYTLYNKDDKSADLKTYFSNYRLDEKTPLLTVTGDDEENTDYITVPGADETTGYAKYATINIASDEDSFLLSSGKDNRGDNGGYATMRLTDAGGTVSQSIRGYNVDPNDEDAKGFTSQTIPLTDGEDGTDVTISLKNKVEGEFRLVIEGEDKAKNAYKKTSKLIKLDNKPPETELVSTEEGKKEGNGGSIVNKYKVRLSDASGTGTIWYMFTETDPNTAKKLPTDKDTGESGDSSGSGELSSLLGRWSSYTMNDLKNGAPAELVLEVADGDTFNGSLIWYAVDGVGNKSDYTIINNIKISNESAEYEILPSAVSVYRPSYRIEVISPNNTISYRWKKATTGKSDEKDYLFSEYRTAENGIIDTTKDAETNPTTAKEPLDGEYILELKIQTPSGATTLYPQKSFVFDGAGPDVRISVPSGTAYNTSASVSVNIDDRAGVSVAKGIIVKPDPKGSGMDGQKEFDIPVSGGAVESYTPNLSDLPSGAYALKITATDVNNQATTVVSDPFYVRNGAPEGTTSVNSTYSHNGYPIIADAATLSLNFDITESFRNAENAPNAPKQTLYYRVDPSDASNGEWRAAGTLTAEGDKLTFKGSSAISDLDFIDGKNTLYVQMMIYPAGIDITKLNTVNIAQTETVFYVDEQAPDQPTVIIDDVHTTGTVSGRIAVSDNSLDFDGVLTAQCNADGVTIGAYSGGAFPLEATKNVKNATVYIYDEAQHCVTADFSVNGIDNVPPTVSINTAGIDHGARRDAEATVRVEGMTGDAEFALIKAEDYEKAYKDGKIGDAWFKTDHYYDYDKDEGVLFTVTKLYTEEAYYDGEVNAGYRLSVAGATGDWLVGVRAKDAVGNECDTVFGDDYVLSTIDAKISITATNADDNSYENWSVAPKNAADIAVVTASFNVPVYVLPQDKAAKKTESECYDLLEQYVTTYSQTASFTITKIGTYKLYAMDELGRKACIEINVDGDDVSFGNGGDVKATICTLENLTDESGNTKYDSHGVPVPYYKPVSGEICVDGIDYTTKYYLVVEPIVGEDESEDNVLLYPSYNRGDDDFWDWHYNLSNHFNLEDDLTARYAVTRDGHDLYSDSYETYKMWWENPDGHIDWAADTGIIGFTKLIYGIQQFTGDGADETTDRLLKVRRFDKNAGLAAIPEGATAHETDNKDTRYMVVSGIDNTAPYVTWTADPEVLTYGEDEITKHPTPGDVTFTVTGRDRESGIGRVVALVYDDYVQVGNEWEPVTKEIDVSDDFSLETDGTDESNSFLVWDGADEKNKITRTVRRFDEKSQTGSYVQETVTLPSLKITYYPSHDGDDVPTLHYTFTDALDLTQDIRPGWFENTLGGKTSISAGSEKGISTVGLIYKMNIEEGKDYKLSYTDKDGKPIEDLSAVYCNNATATVTILDRGEERGLKVSNNNGSTSKKLSVYQPEFEFKLKDKYGYTASVTAKLEKFDDKPGEIEYTLSKYGKTNEAIVITVTATDDGSGVDTVTLGGTCEVALTDAGNGVYTGSISQNGTYNIVLYDKAGNKSVKTFSVSNVNTVKPTADVTFSSDGHDDVTVDYNGSNSYDSGTTYYTSRPVRATLSFSKTNVRITSVEPWTADDDEENGAGEENNEGEENGDDEETESASFTAADYSVDYGTSEITFLRSGTLVVEFTDDYGNVSEKNFISVGNIDSTPPTIVVDTVTKNANSVDVTFKLDPTQQAVRGGTRKETDIMAAYGGVVKRIAEAEKDENGEIKTNEKGEAIIWQNAFTFTENGTYTLKVYEENEPLTSYCKVEVEGIDKSAPKVTLLEWWYGDDETNAEKPTLSEGALGYRVATDKYTRTNEDVTVRITTDSETKLSGVSDGYGTQHSRVYSENGLFTFNTEKSNGKITQYGVDIQVIDKTPPVIELDGGSEIICYENAEMNEEGFSLADALKKYRAYDVFNGCETDLTDSVTVSYTDADGRTLNPDNLSANEFDSSKPYTVTYTAKDTVGNVATAYRTVRLVGKTDPVVLVNGTLPNSSGKVYMNGDSAKIELKNFSGTAYVKYQKGLKTMGQMKTSGEVLSKNESGEYVREGLSEGWHTFYIQTDRRDYFTIGVYTAN